MDKKQQQQYSRQGSNKALSSDSRKSSELYSNKPWPKNSSRRENSNCPASKNDSQRDTKKVGPAKNRPNVDKRPKPRGSAFGVGNANSTFEDLSSSSSGLAVGENLPLEFPSNGRSDQFKYELNSVYSTGSKKKNLNHLLNFNYAPREGDNYSGLNVFGKNARPYAKKHKYNKEQYLQANFQFVVNWKSKPKITSSPDALIEWNLIEQINIQTTEEPQCPICLYPPVAAKLTRCGHVYCWPCILHYLALTDKTWRKCPICYEAIHTSDLKSTTIVQQVNFRVGDYINLNLMQRKKGSLFIEKFNNLSSNDEELPLYSDKNDAASFAKFLVANASDVMSIIAREEQELNNCNGEEDCPEFIFVQNALDLLKERKADIEKEIDIDSDKKIIDKLTSQIENNCNLHKVSANTDDENDISKSESENDQNKKFYYFYQSTDGQNIFLHPLNVKMLQACYGSLDKAPESIFAKIIQKEHHSMDEDHRRKFTCLGHLPLTCHFEVVEVGLEPPIVSEEVMSIFKGDIMQRRKDRMKRDREEKKREKQINAINDRQMGKLLSSAANINLSSALEFPTCGFEETLSASPDQFFTEPMDIPPRPSTSKRNTYSSVANSEGSIDELSFPSIGGAAGYSPNVPKNSTWIKEVTPMRPRWTSGSSECDSVNEFLDILHPTPNLGDVLAEAISQKNKTTAKNENNSGNKKSKKNKKMLLFSTGMNYSGK